MLQAGVALGWVPVAAQSQPWGQGGPGSQVVSSRWAPMGAPPPWEPPGCPARTGSCPTRSGGDCGVWPAPHALVQLQTGGLENCWCGGAEQSSKQIFPVAEKLWVSWEICLMFCSSCTSWMRPDGIRGATDGDKPLQDPWGLLGQCCLRVPCPYGCWGRCCHCLWSSVQGLTTPMPIPAGRCSPTGCPPPSPSSSPCC